MTEKKGEDNIIMLVDVRLAFPQLWTATQVNGEGKAAFSASFLMPPDHPDVAKIKAAIAKTATAKWGAKTAEYLPVLVASDKVCLHNGDLKSNLEGYTGNLFVSARGPMRPLVIDADKSVLTEADGRPYSGCFVNAQIALWAQENNYGKRINAQLRGVQFLRDGEAFSGGGVASPDEFEPVAQDADDAAPEVAAGGAEDYSALLG
jgi:hypothetical protein